MHYLSQGMQYIAKFYVQLTYSPVATDPTIGQYVGLASKLVAASTLCSNSILRKGGSSAVPVLEAPINVHELSLLNLLCNKQW